MPGATPAGHSKRVECPICQKRFARQDAKSNHILVVHENAGRFKCSHCHKTFRSAQDKAVHERSHTGERPFECPICQRRFSSKKYREDHVIVAHENAGRFQCGHCDKTFQNKQNFESHVNVHTAEKPFRCEICQMQMKSKFNLKIHHLDQHSEKKFTCETCGKGFGRTAPLQQHLLSHSNERINCDLCGKSFKQISLRGHMKAIHSGIQRKTPRPRRMVRDEDQKGHQKERQKERQKSLRVKFEQADGSNDLSSATRSLRVRRKTPNYIDQDDADESEESGSVVQDGGDEPSEPDEESGGENKVVERDGEEKQDGDRVSDNEMPEKRVKTKNLVTDVEVCAFDDPIRGSQSPNEVEQVGDLPPQSSTVSGTNLKVVYDLEYRPH